MGANIKNFDEASFARRSGTFERSPSRRIRYGSQHSSHLYTKRDRNIMHAHFVLAHPEPKSFNAHLVRVGTGAFASKGWTTSVSDLYAAAFDPCERPEHYASRLDAKRFDAQAEQRHASTSASLPRAVIDELASLDRADVLVLQYPMWWHLPPAILKGWFDRVLAYGEVYASRGASKMAALSANGPCSP